MAGLAQGGDGCPPTAGDGMVGGVAEKLEEPDHSSSNWFFPREHIEKHSPSRKDGIDLKKETYLRKSYCTFLQDLGMHLKVPQVTIATAIVFCHRFFLRQSHAKNDRYLIATSCMFLAGKVEETPQKLCDVIYLSYEIRNKKDPTAVQRIKQKEVYEPQKELVLLGERLVLTTLGFDLNIHHPYKPLVAAIKKFKVAQNALAQVAWNFVNDGLRTSLCLQFKPHHIAAGAIFLAAKFLKVKLPSEGEKVWWQEFDVTPRQLEEVSNQMLELYEQNREAPASRSSDPSTSAAMSTHNRTAAGEAPPSGYGALAVDRNVAGDAKARANINNPKQTQCEADGNAETYGNPRGGVQNARLDAASFKADAKTAPISVVESECILASETKPRTDANGIAKPADEASCSASQVAKKDPHSEHIDDINGTLDMSLLCPIEHEGDQNLNVGTEERSPSAISSRAAGDTTPLASAQSNETKLIAGADVAEQNQDLGHHPPQPKSELVDLGGVDIDRVKAAIQRRKKGDVRPPVIKSELTDEEEMLEMDLENERKTGHDWQEISVKKEEEAEGSTVISDAEAEELLEMGLEVGERKKHQHGHGGDSYLLQKHQQRLDLGIDNHHNHMESEEQERDHKRPRLAYGQ